MIERSRIHAEGSVGRIFVSYQFGYNNIILLDCYSQVVMMVNHHSSWNDPALSYGMNVSCKLLFEM